MWHPLGHHRPMGPRSTQPPSPQFLLFPPKPTIGSWTIGGPVGGLVGGLVGGPVGPQKPMFSLMISMVFHSAHISTSLGDRGSHWGSDQSSFGGSRMHSQALRFSPKSTSETSPKSTSEKTFRTVGALGAPLGSPGASPGRKIFSEVDIGEKV